MDYKQAINLLLNRFRGANTKVIHNALSGTSATITVPKDCWLTVSGVADTGITLAPTIFLYANGQLLANAIGVTYQGTSLVVSAYVKKGTEIIANSYRCQLTGYNIFW